MRTIESMAKYAIDAKHLDKIGGVAGATAIALYAREIGLPIMASLYGGIRPVLGKIEISPQMMNALIRKSGHKLQTKAHTRSEEHTSELQSQFHLVCRLLLEKKKKHTTTTPK